jgi:hypothetical protein
MTDFKFKVLTLSLEPLTCFCRRCHMHKKVLMVLFFVLWVVPAFAEVIQTNPDSIHFAPAVNYDAGDDPYSVFCADLDGDGDMDLAVANWGSANVAILKNNGDGTIQTAVNYGAGDSPWSVFCADLDGDGNLDLAVANANSNTVSVLKNFSQVSGNTHPILLLHKMERGIKPRQGWGKGEEVIILLVEDVIPDGSPSFSTKL